MSPGSISIFCSVHPRLLNHSKSYSLKMYRSLISQDAEDCYDVIEALAAMPWSNGKVGMAGNSALAIIQWHVASLRPPHIAAIAP